MNSFECQTPPPSIFTFSVKKLNYFVTYSDVSCVGNIASTSKQHMSHGAELKTKSSIAHEPHSIDDLTKGILHFIKQDDLIG